ncbi:MAG: extracellular solute-binding protein [Propionibacteriaceae bacterium]|nr:extracellular solute-binding protein [Propionibacteriaceae bacterium]
MKKQLSLIALGVAGAMALAACGGGGDTGGSSAPPTTDAPAGADIRVWLVGTDTPDAARDYLKQTFESENPGSTLVIEEQAWGGLVDKYTTALSGSDSPDVVEIGNTQAATFTSAGAFLDLTDKKSELGSDMLPGFVEAGSYEGKFYAAPYYSGARVVTYSTDIVTGDLPTTWEAFLADAEAKTTDTVSGLYMPGKDWRDFVTFVWANGGEIATVDSAGKWTAQLSQPEAIKGLTQFQTTFAKANNAPSDITESELQVPFCAGQVGYLMSPSWVYWSIAAAEDADTPGCSATVGDPSKLHQFALPGVVAGTYAPVLAGGSNIAVAAKSKNTDLAYKALKIMLSDGYQKILAENGMVPALISQAKYLPDTESSKAASNAASAAKLTPASPAWSDVEAQQILEDGFAKIAAGEDVAKVASDLDAKINSILNA